MEHLLEIRPKPMQGDKHLPTSMSYRGLWCQWVHTKACHTHTQISPYMLDSKDGKIYHCSPASCQNTRTVPVSDCMQVLLGWQFSIWLLRFFNWEKLGGRWPTVPPMEQISACSSGNSLFCMASLRPGVLYWYPPIRIRLLKPDLNLKMAS